LIAYQQNRNRSKWESVAFSAVCALCAVIAIGYVIELLPGTVSTETKTKMTETRFLLIWLAASTAVFFVDRLVFQVRANQPYCRKSSTLKDFIGI
jgi:hypothetical protein